MFVVVVVVVVVVVDVVAVVVVADYVYASLLQVLASLCLFLAEQAGDLGHQGFGSATFGGAKALEARARAPDGPGGHNLVVQ